MICCSLLHVQRAEAAKTGAPAMSKRGQPLHLANITKPGTKECKWAQAIPALAFLGQALKTLLLTRTAPDQVIIKTMLAVPRYAGVVDIVRSHAAFTNRTANCLEPDNIAYQAYDLDRRGNKVYGTWYGQVLALGTVVGSGVNFIFFREYDNGGLDSYFPLNLRPFKWAQPTRRTGQGSYAAIETDSVLNEVCMVPDYVKNAADGTKGHFLLNDLVHRAPDDMLAWYDKKGKDAEDNMVWKWNKAVASS